MADQSDDEREIRAMIAAWMEASRRGDHARMLTMLTDDVLFLTPGREPFGKDGFAAQSQGQSEVEIDGTADILELVVLGEYAYLRVYLEIGMRPAKGEARRVAGHTLTILRKTAGRWQIARDANFVA